MRLRQTAGEMSSQITFSLFTQVCNQIMSCEKEKKRKKKEQYG